jgi:hypothetical protein
LKKSAQKTFAIPGRAGETACGPDSKSFLLLFFKKEALPFFAQWPRAGRVLIQYDYFSPAAGSGCPSDRSYIGFEAGIARHADAGKLGLFRRT